jgi:phosphatidate cytidylyltransferase
MMRILTAAVLIPTIVWAVLWAPSWAFLLVMALVGMGAFREFDKIAGSGAGWLGMAAGVALLLMPEPALPLLVALAAMFLALQLGETDLKNALSAASAALLGIVYIFGAWRCATLLRESNPHWLMIALLVSWAGDTAAMYVGKAWGKRKLAPRVSPGKTQEGAAASVIAGTITAVVYANYFIPFEPLPQVVIGQRPTSRVTRRFVQSAFSAARA